MGASVRNGNDPYILVLQAVRLMCAPGATRILDYQSAMFQLILFESIPVITWDKKDRIPSFYDAYTSFISNRYIDIEVELSDCRNLKYGF